MAIFLIHTTPDESRRDDMQYAPQSPARRRLNLHSISHFHGITCAFKCGFDPGNQLGINFLRVTDINDVLAHASFGLFQRAGIFTPIFY